VPPHSWFPGEQFHSRPHSSGLPLQVAVAPEAPGQGVQLAPHVAGEVLLTHWPLHQW
jgi:hypothetical protein